MYCVTEDDRRCVLLLKPWMSNPSMEYVILFISSSVRRNLGLSKISGFDNAEMFSFWHQTFVVHDEKELPTISTPLVHNHTDRKIYRDR